jgi:hypothetical protein
MIFSRLVLAPKACRRRLVWAMRAQWSNAANRREGSTSTETKSTCAINAAGTPLIRSSSSFWACTASSFA